MQRPECLARKCALARFLAAGITKVGKISNILQIHKVAYDKKPAHNYTSLYLCLSNYFAMSSINIYKNLSSDSFLCRLFDPVRRDKRRIALTGNG